MTLLPQVPGNLLSMHITLTLRSLSAIGWCCLFTLTNAWVGRATSMTVLGIELDLVNQVARLPEDKFLAPRELIHSWLSNGWCRKQELESLIGHLHHAAKVVWPGRAFLRQFINLLCCFRNKNHPVEINQEVCLLPQTWRSPRMQLTWLALVPILEASGFMVLGQWCRPISYIQRTFSCGDCCWPLG